MGNVQANVHVHPDSGIGVWDMCVRHGSPLASVNIGDASILLTSHDDAVKLVKAAEEAASILLAAEADQGVPA